MDPETRRVATSPQLWIYFATAVGASIATVILYWLMAGFPKLPQRSKEEGEEIPRSMHRTCTDIEKDPKIIGS